MKKKKSKNTRVSTPVSRMDDACFSHDPLEQFCRRKYYIESGRLDADQRGSAKIEERIRMEELT